MTTARNRQGASVEPRYAPADAFLEGLAAQDFARLGGALASDARLRALLPSGLWEWAGAEVIADRFARWFGDSEDFELVEAAVGEVGGRLHLHWQLRLRAERLGTGWFTVEQQVYADTASPPPKATRSPRKSCCRACSSSWSPGTTPRPA